MGKLTFPKTSINKISQQEYFDVFTGGWPLILTSVAVGSADMVRQKLQEPGITQEDVKNAVAWAREG